MPLKKNSSGKLQNYDSKTGRYIKANVIDKNEKIDGKSVLNRELYLERNIHILVGDFTPNSNKHISGGHAQDNLDYLIVNNIPYEINLEYNNGVRLGSILNTKNPAGHCFNNHSWFPKDWDNRTIEEAIEYGLNKYNGTGEKREYFEFEYLGVRITIIFAGNMKISTAFPSKNQDGGIKNGNR